MTPEIEKVRELTTELYSQYMKGTGCCLHILTDDSNIEDHHVDFCVDYAEKAVAKGPDKHDHDHKDCLALAKLYQQLTKRERAIALRMGWCPTCEDYSCCGICHDCDGSLDPIPDEDPA